MKKRRFVSLFRKQLLVTGIFSLLLTIGTSTYQFFSNLEQLRTRTDETLRQALLTTTDTLHQLLVDNRLQEVEVLLEQVFSFAPAAKIKLSDTQAQELISLPHSPPSPRSPWWGSRFLEPTRILRFPVGTDPHRSWIVEIRLDNELASKQQARTFLTFLLTNFILCSIATLTFYILLHILFTRQISKLTNQLKRLRGEDDSLEKMEVSEFHRNDEMGILADIINELWQSRQQLQRNLTEQNQTIATVTAISPVGLFRTDTAGELIWYNQKARVLLGILGYEKSLDEWLGNLHPSHQSTVRQSWQDAITGESPMRAEFPLRQTDNELRWVICEAIPSWSGGHFEGLVGTLTDVTPLKQATVKLHESEERYHAITQTANSAIILTESNGNISYWNPAAEKIFGYTREEALGENLAALLIPAASRHVFAEACPEFEEHEGEYSGELIELEACAKDGTVLQVEMSLSAFKMEGNWHAAMIISDISKRIISEKERVNLLDQLRQSQKMEAIGTLAGGIAHDFNNILTPILGFGQLLQGHFAGDSKERDRIDKIMASATRAKDLVGQILAFSRKSQEEAQPILVTPALREALKLLRAGIPATIEIKTRIPSTDFWILADPTRIHQILMNLATNAVQAMTSKGGVLGISLDHVKPNPDSYSSLPAGDYLRLQVSDTGTGIDEYTRERIFDPYFTTKSNDAGTGLGLTMVQSSVSSLGGMIELESEIGKGSTFSVLLPLLSGPFQLNEVRQFPLPHGTGEHLLLVDDEMSLINIGREFLEDLGYQVTGTTSSREALEMVEKDPDRFAMLITDQTMPQLTGLDLSRQVHKLRPDLPVIICTGQRDLLSDAELEQVNILQVFSKPDLFQDLAACLSDYFCTPPLGEDPEDLNIWSESG